MLVLYDSGGIYATYTCIIVGFVPRFIFTGFKFSNIQKWIVENKNTKKSYLYLLLQLSICYFQLFQALQLLFPAFLQFFQVPGSPITLHKTHHQKRVLAISIIENQANFKYYSTAINSYNQNSRNKGRLLPAIIVNL